MRILIAHSRYLSGPVSGENRVVEDEARLLRDGGHEVLVWDPAPPETMEPRDLVKAGTETVWSRRAAAHLRSLLREFGPQVVHCHNLFPTLSPTVLRVASTQGVPLAMTLHNYRLMCLPATLLRNNRPCEDCLGHVPWRGVRHRCYRGSVLGSSALATSLTVHRALGSFNRVSLFIAISEFIKGKHTQAGIDESKIRVKPHFAWPTRKREGPGSYFAYVGRLSEEKGIDFLVKLWRQIDHQLVVVGDGPQEGMLRETAPASVRFVGSVEPEEVAEILTAARALLVPSMWYEPAGKVVLEAYAAGIPVVASSMGALPELVQEGRSGFLASAGVERQWARSVERLSDDDEAERLGDAARGLWHSRYRPEHGLENLEAAYRRTVELA